MKVTVLGSGTMGHGIAQVSAMAQHDVTIRDIEEDIVESGIDQIKENLDEGVERDKITEEKRELTLEHLSGTTDLEAAVSDADLIIEAVPEDLELKKKTFQEVEEAAPDNAIIATNTSSMSVTEIISALEDPQRGIGAHFFNPVHILNLVEIITGEQTGDETAKFVEDFAEGIEKTPILVQDYPGFASSRLGIALGVEAMRMLQEGVASPQDIDTAAELGYNHPMGPIELTDHVGLDIRLDILEYLREELGDRFRPPQILKQKVRAGKLGKKTGEGFYIWEDGEIIDTSDNWDDYK
jgi:3-hydroxybutyryl-CoA dehydrogenase